MTAKRIQTIEKIFMALVKKLKPHFAPRTKRKAYYADINFNMLG
ncbi:hypothetical protein [Paenibacillus sp. NPDC101420]